MRLRPGFHGLLRGYDAPVNPKREKAIPARGAAIGGKAEQAEQPGEHAHSMLARNALQVHVAAHSAMHIPDISDGSRPGIKARVASSAAPGPQPCHSHQVVLDTSSAGPAGTVAMTDRTKQIFFTPGKSAKRIREGLLQWQVPSAQGCRSMYNERREVQDGRLHFEHARAGIKTKLPPWTPGRTSSPDTGLSRAIPSTLRCARKPDCPTTERSPLSTNRKNHAWN